MMAGTYNHRGSMKQSSAGQNMKEESDRDVQEPFTPTDTSDTNDESEVSEYSPTERGKKHMKKKKPKRKRTVVKLRRAPSLPEMSDIEYDSDSGSPELGDYIQARKPMSTPKQEVSGINQLALQNSRTEVTPISAKTPNVVQIHLNAGAAAGGTTINLDLSDLVLGKRSFDEIGWTCLPTPDGSDAPATPISVVIDETSQVSSGTLYPPSKRIRMLGNAKARFPSTQQSKKGFCDIPFELRVRIYRQVFVTETPIDFASRDDFQRSSSLLSTCQLVHCEGRAVLYGENAFHFERSHGTRGAFFESTWKEIGFKDARRFLETIGIVNISMMRYISFHFQDAAPSTSPHLDENERRFVNDPILHHVLKLIGAYARLSKIAFQFSGRRLLQKSDYNFLQALSSIKSEEVIHTERMAYSSSKVGDVGIIRKLHKVMTVPQGNETDIDIGKKKGPTVRMFHERPRASHYYGGW